MPEGRVLVSYIIESFIVDPDDPVFRSHTNYWETRQIVNTFLELGYAVDLISYRNTSFRPDCNYDYLVGARTNMEQLASLLNDSCIKVAHLDTAHWITNNHHAYVRLLDLKNRRNISLWDMKTIEVNRAIEFADLATILGNEFTIESYAFAKKPVYRIPISAPSTYDWDDSKDFNQCRNNYMWFGSGGFVHKGLDLVLDAFREMPRYNLTVFGPVEHEKEFEDAYYKELYETPNIKTIGWLDIDSPDFLEYAGNTAALIYPTCAEGGGGSAITCMHAGVIPVLSYEASVDMPGCGFLLENCSVEEIKKTITRVSALPADQLESTARRAWEYARKVHTRDNFAKEFREFATTILQEFRNTR
jgi:glycosyltransferase involved in cell wall biosynthesis